MDAARAQLHAKVSTYFLLARDVIYGYKCTSLFHLHAFMPRKNSQPMHALFSRSLFTQPCPAALLCLVHACACISYSFMVKKRMG